MFLKEEFITEVIDRRIENTFRKADSPAVGHGVGVACLDHLVS